MKGPAGALVGEIWSGGQTGVDRAALDVALELGIAHGGWVPAGRRAEDGTVPARYNRLRETESSDYAFRTDRNVRDTGATLLVSFGTLTGGSLHTKEVIEGVGKPFLHLDLDEMAIATASRLAREWLASFPTPVRLNVAGPRASGVPRAYDRTALLLHAILSPSPPVGPGDQPS